MDNYLPSIFNKFNLKTKFEFDGILLLTSFYHLTHMYTVILIIFF